MNEKEKKQDEFDFKGAYHKKYENVKNLLQSALNQIEKIQNIIDNLEKEERKAHYQNIPGTEGVFDGQYLVAEDGRKTEVPPNYAAKSKLVYGDILKVFMDSGKQIFKQIDRVERKVIEGVLTKKEGKWYLLSDVGSYKVSDASAEFNKAKINDRAFALIPAENTKVPFACLDRIITEHSDFGDLENSEISDKNKKMEMRREKHKIPQKKKSSEDRGSFNLKNRDNKPGTFEGKSGNQSPKNKEKDRKVKDQSKKQSNKITNEETLEKAELISNTMDEDDLR